MKKLILSLALVTGMLLNATPLTTTSSAVTFGKAMYTTEVSTFVKLIKKGDYATVKSMIVAGTDVNKKSKGMTPLMYAARHNKAEITKLLIQHGADLKVKSDRGYSALDYAKMHKAHNTYKIIADAIKTQKLERKKKRKRRRA